MIEQKDPGYAKVKKGSIWIFKEGKLSVILYFSVALSVQIFQATLIIRIR